MPRKSHQADNGSAEPLDLIFAFQNSEPAYAFAVSLLESGCQMNIQYVPESSCWQVCIHSKEVPLSNTLMELDKRAERLGGKATCLSHICEHGQSL